MDLPTARLRETQLKFCPGNSNLGQVDKNKSSQGPFIYLFSYLFVCFFYLIVFVLFYEILTLNFIFHLTVGHWVDS